MHREENVDVEERLASIVAALDRLQRSYGVAVVVSTHPRTSKRIHEFGIALDNDEVRFMPPFGFFDFVALERSALCVLTDSGTVQEECAIFKVPNVTMRDVTERPETIECGGNMLSGTQTETIVDCVKTVLALERSWNPPGQYLRENVSELVIKILTGYLHRTEVCGLKDVFVETIKPEHVIASEAKQS
jgi:UDP-N-acetylglucosamine 2-epimerase (non-hydrolysing)